MRNILLEAAFTGENYHGFQIQPEDKTVAGEINKALGRVLCEEVSVVGCSRTDRGVHARQFFMNFKTEKDIPTENILKGANTYLPRDIVIKSARETDLDFHARYDTKYKEYKYYILNSEIRNPFYENRAYHYTRHIDFEAFSGACKYFIGKHDFAAFSNVGNDYESTERTVYECYAEKQGDMIVFTVSADGFLYNMVRIMVGTLISVGVGAIPKDSVPAIIESKNRAVSGETVPPQGLYLNKVVYGKDGDNG